MRAPVFVLLAAVAFGAAASAEDAARPAMEGFLEVGDEAILHERIGETMGSAAVAALRAVINDGEGDFGIRLRAIRVLGAFRTPESRDALHAVMTAHGRCKDAGAAVTGAPLLQVRAALESMAAIGDPTDFDWIVPCLQARSRDLRVAAARALRDLNVSAAVCPLQRQRDAERVPQVQSAISEALRAWPPQICSRDNSVRNLTDE